MDTKTILFPVVMLGAIVFVIGVSSPENSYSQTTDATGNTTAAGQNITVRYEVRNTLAPDSGGIVFSTSNPEIAKSVITAVTQASLSNLQTTPTPEAADIGVLSPNIQDIVRNTVSSRIDGGIAALTLLSANTGTIQEASIEGLPGEDGEQYGGSTEDWGISANIFGVQIDLWFED